MNTAQSHQPSQRMESYGNSAMQREQFKPSEDVVDYVKSYARQNPETAALWCFCIGFIVGWKLKPW